MAKASSTTDALIKKLTSTIEELTAVVSQLNARLTAQEQAAAAREAELVAQVDALKRRVFGKKSEKMPSTRKELRAKDEPRDPERRSIVRQLNRERRAALPSQEVLHAVPAEQRECPRCERGDATMKPLGDGRRTMIYDYVPGYFRKHVHVQEVLACTCSQHVVTAPAPERVWDKCAYGPGLLAYLAVAKCADSIPIYRIEKHFARMDIPMSRSTMNDLFHRMAQVLTPLHKAHLRMIAQRCVVLADETPMRMQQRKKRAYLWTFRADKLIAYVFSKSRSGDTPRTVLGGTRGVLVVDGYTGYNTVLDVDGRVRAGCMAHVRRKFFDATQTAPEEVKSVLAIILELYRIEHQASDIGIVGTEQHAQMRSTQGRAVMSKLLRTLRAQRGVHLPKSPFGMALSHALRNWRALTLYLRHPQVPIDNNASERALRVVALGRKNFLFVGDVEAGENLAVLYSLVSTCEALGINPQTYLADVLMRVQTHPQSRIDELLPQSWAPTAS